MGEVLAPDLCIIGAGAGGLAAAATAAALGVPTVLIEQAAMGGEGLHAGSAQSHALIAAAARAQMVRDAARFGIGVPEPQIDYSAIMRHVRDSIAAIAPTQSAARFAAMGVRVIRAAARFIDRLTVRAGDILIRARRFVLATGSRPALPAIPGLDGVGALTTETVFALTGRPDHLLVIGGGRAGCELAQAFARLGSRVTIVERDHALAGEDPEAAAIVLTALRREGVAIEAGATVAAAEPLGSGVAVRVRRGDKEITIAGSHILVAAGRVPSLDDLGLDAAGIAHDAAGIGVDRGMRTSNRRVYAIGDCAAGQPRFTHAATWHAGLVLRSALFRLPAKADPRAVPRVTFTDPGIAACGLTETEARRRGHDIRLLRWPFAENDRAVVTGAREGHVKVVADRRGRILGATIVGAGASELIAPWSLAIGRGHRIGAMRDLIAAYPTLSEASRRAAVQFDAAAADDPRLGWLLRFLRRFG